MFVNTELKRQIDFLAEIEFKPPFNLPPELTIDISKNVYKYKKLIDDATLAEVGLKYIIELSAKQLPYQPHELVTWLLYKNLLRYRSYLNRNLYLDLNSEYLTNLFKEQFLKLDELSPGQEMEFTKIKKVIDSYYKVLTTQRISFHDLESGYTLLYRISEYNQEFYDFINSVNELMLGDSFLYYSWRGLSSGEKAFLSLFSRINDAKKKIQIHDDFIKNNLIIMMDECDLYLHPEWQRSLLNTLITYLPKIFPGKKLQLIVSSHSPFLVSDLPSENIILLDKDENEHCTVLSKERLGKTFGANIHTLYAHPFILNSTIGEFAKEKINSVITTIIGTDVLTPDIRQRLLNTIDLIGEPVIKTKLRKMFIDKFGKAEEILMLENRLQELRGQ
jgi:hypothetical protein